MKYEATSPEEYIHQIPQDRQESMQKLRNVILNNLPKGFKEMMSYGMIGYVVPHAIYPDGYHCTPNLPLPFINIASQKNFIAFYHMGIYADKKIYDWFVAEFPKHSKHKLDMGKSCIRFKKPDQIPFKLIGELVQKISVTEWINLYELMIKKGSSK